MTLSVTLFASPNSATMAQEVNQPQTNPPTYLYTTAHIASTPDALLQVSALRWTGDTTADVSVYGAPLCSVPHKKKMLRIINVPRERLHTGSVLVYGILNKRSAGHALIGGEWAVRQATKSEIAADRDACC
ncbi:MAG: hypothetical protein ACXWNJ_17440 [Vulcanimicrobiaceae bacterium]